MSAGSSSVADDPALDMLSRLDCEQSRRLYLDQNPALVTAESVEALADAVRRYVRVDVSLALRAGEAAFAVAERLGDCESLARAMRARGNAHWFEGKCRAAVDLFEEAIARFGQVGRFDEVGRTLSTSIQPLILLGEYDAALRNAGRARDLFTTLNDELRLARLDINVANIYHRQERFAEALAAYEQAYQRLLPHRDAEGIGVALHNIAVCLISLDDFDHALEVYGHASEFLQKHGMPKLALQADYNIAYLYHLRGDYEKSIELLRATLARCAEDDPYHAALSDLDLSEIYLELNLFSEANERAGRAVDSFERLSMGYELARSLTNLAIAATHQRQPERAIQLFERAKERFAAEGHKSGEALVNLYHAMLLSKEGETGQAKLLCSRAAEVFRSSGFARKAVLCDLLLSRLALAEGSLNDAETHCIAAEGHLASMHAPVLNYEARLQRGRLLEVKGDDAQSCEAYGHAAAELEALRCALEGEELKIAFGSNRIEVYERLTALALKDGHCGPAAERAFGYIERAKSRNLTESLFGRARPLPRLTAANGPFGGKLRRLRGELNWFYHRIQSEEISGEGVGSARLERLWTEARSRENEVVELLRDNRGLSARQHADSESSCVTLSDIRSALEPGSVLIEYFQIGDHLLAGVLTRTGLDIVPLSKAAGVRKRLRSVQLQLSRALLPTHPGGPENAPPAAMMAHLKALYGELIAPVERHLQGNHLILAPHGCLHYLPLHALHDGSQYLIDRFSVSYVPSASIYSLCHRNQHKSGTRSLVLGIEDARAPWIALEVQEVASVVPQPHLLTGADARLSALKLWGEDSRLIHIATHGYFRTDNPLFSAIQLADSYLTVYDLYDIRLPVELLTLSGCATGLNVVAAGDELLGLVRGLLYAGARTLLLTLWDIHDRSTAEFMRLFYTRLQQGEGKAGAVRGAMLEMRERFPHPSHWAPFVLVGKVP